MNPPNRSNRALIAGLVLSLGIHLATFLGFGWARLGSLDGVALSARDQAQADLAKTLELSEDVSVHLGIAESDAVTISWLGFEVPTEHRAPEATTDQAALTRDPGPAEAPPEVTEAPSQAPADAPEARPQSPAEAITDRGDEQAFDSLLAEIGPLIEQLTGAAAAISNPPPPSPGSEQAGSGEPGEASDRDSDPTAIAGTIDVVPGHPAARKGLEIKTVRPKWLTLTRMTTSPTNPTIIIHFKRNGTVADAQFEAGKGTGSPSVDGPLLDAVYAWRAKGEALDKLSASDPRASLEVRIRVIMR